MRITCWKVWVIPFLIWVSAGINSCTCPGQQKNIRALVITGGHEYDIENFDLLLGSLNGIQFDEIAHPEANEIMDDDTVWNYQVLVFYDMNQDITENQKKSFIDLTKKGMGLVFLHHSLASYQDWPEFAQIRGGRYDLDSSAYDFKQRVAIAVVDPKMPITRGLEDWVQTEETYSNFYLNPSVKPLLASDHPKSGPVIGWYHKYQKSRVVYLQPGHDNNAYSNANFRQLLRQAIVWAAH